MAWKEATQLTSSEGDVSSGILNDATGEFWYQRTDPESGQTMWRSTSGGLSAADPRGQDTLGGLLKYGNPTVMQGGEGGTTSIYTPNLQSIGGNAMGAFQIRQSGPDQWQALNPQTGAWEQAYHVPESIAGNTVTVIPKSLAASIPGAAIFTNKPANNKGGFFEDYALPAIIGGIAGGGLLGMAGYGPMAAGSGSLGNIASGSGAFGATEGLGMAGSFNGLSAGAVPLTSGAAGLGLTEAELAAAGAGLGSGIEGAAIGAGPVAAGAGLAGLGASGVGPFGTAAGTAATSAATTTALQKILSGTATAADWAALAGQALPGIIGAFGANEQANAIKDQTKTLSDIAAKYDAYGAPSRARYEASMTPGFDPTIIPGYKGALDTASETLLRRLSAQNGNPYGNPGGLIEANKQIVAGTALPAVQQYQNQNANTGALGQLAASQVGANSAVNASNLAGINAGSGVWNALGNVAGNVFNPPQTASQSLADIYKLINSGMKAA